MAENEPDAVKVAVKGEFIALPWELVPPEIVKKALELKAVRLEGLPPLLQHAVIQLGFRPPNNAARMQSRPPCRRFQVPMYPQLWIWSNPHPIKRQKPPKRSKPS